MLIDYCNLCCFAKDGQVTFITIQENKIGSWIASFVITDSCTGLYLQGTVPFTSRI